MGFLKLRNQKKICRSLLLEDRVFNTDFLIDTINTVEQTKKKKK